MQSSMSHQSLSFSSSSQTLYPASISSGQFGDALQSFGSSNTPIPVSLGVSAPDSNLNSPEQFKHNIQLALNLATELRRLSRSAIEGIHNAYHVGINPIQTSADMAALKQNLETLCEFLRQTGIGALPIIPSPNDSTQSSDPNQPPESALQIQSPFPEESQMIQSLTQSVQVLYEKRKRVQDNSAVVGILLQPAPGSEAVSGARR